MILQGDSGGPLVVGGDTLVGVVRSSPVACNEKLKPALYTRVSSYLNFIHKALKDIDDSDFYSLKLPFSDEIY